MVEIDRKVIAESVGKSEADWATGSRSAGGLPPFADREFKRLIEAEGEDSGGENKDPRNDEKAHLQAHMSALIGDQSDREQGKKRADPADDLAGSKESEPNEKADNIDDPAGLIERITNLLPGD